MRLITLLILILISISSFAQIAVTKLDVKSLPKSLKYEGHIIDAVKWIDSLGLNYAITTETGKQPSKGPDNEGFRDAALYAYRYVVKNDSIKLAWRIYDYNEACEFDVDVFFLAKTFAVTDLDNNGIAEVWVMYRNACESDISPATLKIIMYEGNKKYALRGESQVQGPEKGYSGGNFKLDDNFENGNPTFRKYAENLWNKHKID